jgi:hypothetical protein
MNVNPNRTSEGGAGSVSRRFYTERDLAAVLGVSVKTVQGWRFRSQGPPWRRLCGAVRYDVVEFENWVAAAPGGGGQ